MIPQAQKVESNHSDTHQLRDESSHTRPLVLIWATPGVCYLVFILTVLKQILKVLMSLLTSMSFGHEKTNNPFWRTHGVHWEFLMAGIPKMSAAASCRRWNQTTLIAVSYGIEGRTPDHWRSSGRH
ncbi:hypothetical protein CEXT_604401 [Caerostris extrusa]|uniref:Uncharacterized protein n=1 Tax=Caerostris extrusa TaxID=172846 RepID=A0AAV4RGP2_CAEEX|nr:hypothetical protein CEXT_604401 [Caerostris extrusa]